MFTACFAKELHISARYVGTEPFSPVTEAYNQALLTTLPQKGIAVRLLDRRTVQTGPISASSVRNLWQQENWDALQSMVPATTLAYLQSHRPLNQ